MTSVHAAQRTVALSEAEQLFLGLAPSGRGLDQGKAYVSPATRVFFFINFLKSDSKVMLRMLSSLKISIVSPMIFA